MSICISEIIPKTDHPDGFTYSVKIESSMQGLARLHVQCAEANSDEAINGQGVDLTAAECRSLAKMLLATAELIE